MFIKLFEKWSQDSATIKSGLRIIKSKILDEVKDKRTRDAVEEYFTDIDWFIKGLKRKLEIMHDAGLTDKIYDKESDKLIKVFTEYLEKEYFDLDKKLIEYFVDYDSEAGKGKVKAYIKYYDPSDNFLPKRKYFKGDTEDEATSKAYRWVEKNLRYFKPEMLGIEKRA